MNLCNISCALPFGLSSSFQLGSPAASLCASCPLFVQRSSSSCSSSCSFVNQTSVNSTSVSICEVAADPQFCPWYQFLNVTAFTCLSQCVTFTIGIQCYASCPASSPLVSAAGSLICINSCPASIYFVNSTINQCNATCALPFGIQQTSLGSSGAFLCSSCSAPLFVQRSTAQCISSCGYVNFTTINSTLVSVCETFANSSYCPFNRLLNGSAFLCLSSCQDVYPLITTVGNLTCVG